MRCVERIFEHFPQHMTNHGNSYTGRINRSIDSLILVHTSDFFLEVTRYVARELPVTLCGKLQKDP